MHDSSFRALALVWGVLMASGCDELPLIAGGTCGNRVVDPGEECDDPSSDACHGPQTSHPCHLDCSAVSCPEGAACGVDAVCRFASGQMSAVPVDVDYVTYLRSTALEPLVGDFNGDRRADALILGPRAATLSFDQSRQASVAELSLSRYGAAVPRINGDPMDDVVFYEDDVDVLQGTLSGLKPATQLRPSPASEAQRFLSADLDGDGRADPLLLADRNLFALPVASDGALVPVGELTVAASQIAGSIPSFPSPGNPACPAICVAAEGASAVDVYELCLPRAKRRQTVALPPPYRVGKGGVHVGDVDGDGLLDLVIDAGPRDEPETYDYLTHVAYGLGDGRFQSQRRGSAGVVADNVAASDPLDQVGGHVLAVGDLDGDPFLDVISDTAEIIFDAGRSGGCEDDACFYGADGGYWGAVAIADFTADGRVDVVGLDTGGRYLTFLLGVGGGLFNRHLIDVGSSSSPEEGSVSIAVGDFDGDLLADLAFTMLDGTRPAVTRSAAVLFGKASALPSELQLAGTVGDVKELLAIETRRFDRESGSDLLFRAQADDGAGVGRLVVAQVGSGRQASASSSGGSVVEPSRLLTSPLSYPRPSVVDDGHGTFIGLAVGAFHGDRTREEAVGLGQFYPDGSEKTSFWLSFAENRESGLAFLDPGDSFLDGPPELVESLRYSWQETPLYPAPRALDVDGDGTDELIFVDYHAQAGAIRCWVARRVDPGWSIVENRIQVPGLGNLELLDVQKGGVRSTDVDRDGKPDLVLQGWREMGTAIIVVHNDGSGSLSAGTAFVIDSDIASGVNDFWEPSRPPSVFANLDQDPALELVVAVGHGLRFYDADVLTGGLEELLSLRVADTQVSGLTAGDFDGDGLDDVAAFGETSAVYFSDPVLP